MDIIVRSDKCVKYFIYKDLYKLFHELMHRELHLLYSYQ